MKVPNFKANMSLFRALILAIFFTLVGLNCHASAQQCRELFEEKSSFWLDNLLKASPDAQKFWHDTAKKFQETLQNDLDKNVAVYQAALREKHPTVDSMFRLGFQYKSGRFIAPNFFFLMKNLDFMRQSSAQPFEFKLMWTLKHKAYDFEQSVFLEPFQDFPAAGLSYNTKTSLVSNDVYRKMIRNGEFPIGGLEAASGVFRVDLERQNGFYYVISDFMHDLSHVQGFIDNPGFAQSYVNVFKSKDIRWQNLEKDLGKVKVERLKRIDEGKFSTFLFAESAWGFHPLYTKYLEQTTLIKKFTLDQNQIDGQVLQNLSPAEQFVLKTELKEIETNWWKIVNPYGGAARDLITYLRFDDAEYQMPMNVVRDSLYILNNKTEWQAQDFNDAALVLRFLREAPNFTPKSWEYFALAPEVSKSKIFNSLKAIFEGHSGNRMSGFSGFAHFLGIKDTSAH